MKIWRCWAAEAYTVYRRADTRAGKMAAFSSAATALLLLAGKKEKQKTRSDRRLASEIA